MGFWLLQEKSILRQFGTTQPPDISRSDVGPGGCALTDAANQIASGAISDEKGEQSNVVALYDGGSFRHLLHPAAFAAICCNLLYMLQTRVHPLENMNNWNWLAQRGAGGQVKSGTT